KIEDAVKKKGGNLEDLKPGTKAWGEARNDIKAALGGGDAAEAAPARSERSRAPAGVGDPGLASYIAERKQLRQVLPDTEVDRIRAVFPEYEVYVAGSATQPGKDLAKSIDNINVVVVVP